MLHFEWVLSAASFRQLWKGQVRPMTVSLRGSQVKVAPRDPRHPELAGTLRDIFAHARLVHCVSEDIEHAARAFDLDPHKARIIRPSVDPSMFQPTRTTGVSAPLRLVSVGALNWRKGYEFALCAVAHAVRAGVDVHYRIIGAGDERDRLQFAVRELGLQDRVRLDGAKSAPQVAEALTQSDALVLSSIDEGIANAVLEGMASGLPVVVTDAGGMREAVTDGVEGFVVPVRDTEAMGNAIVRLASDPALAARMGAAARARVAEQFTLGAQAQQWHRFYLDASAAT